MGNGICSCNRDKTNEANLARALKEEHIIPYQTKGPITKKDDTSITNTTIEGKDESEWNIQPGYIDVESADKQDNKRTLIPQLKDDLIAYNYNYKETESLNENTTVISTNISEEKDEFENVNKLDNTRTLILDLLATDDDFNDTEALNEIATVKSTTITQEKDESECNSQVEYNDIEIKLDKLFMLIPEQKQQIIDDNNDDNDYIKVSHDRDSIHVSDNITNLCICSRNQQDMSILFEDEYYTFDNCNVLTILYSDIKLIYHNMNKFINLRHLEMFKPQINGQRKIYTELYNIINKILDGLSVNLISFKFIASIQHIYRKNKSQMFPVLNIPSTIEWLTVKNVDCNINISKCNKLIGLQLLNNMSYEQIIWPTFDDNICDLIPLIVMCDGKDVDDCQWYDKCKNNEINVKYVCLLKESFIDGRIIYNDNEMIEKFEIDFDICDNDRKCIILNESELNSELYTKIMRYKFRNEIKLKSEKMMMYDDCLWIKQIGNIEYY